MYIYIYIYIYIYYCTHVISKVVLYIHSSGMMTKTGLIRPIRARQFLYNNCSVAELFSDKSQWFLI